MKVNDRMIDSKMGTAKILDLSGNGAKIETSLNLPYQEGKVEIQLQLELELIHGKPFSLPALIVWKKNRVHEYQYGLNFGVNHSYYKKSLSKLSFTLDIIWKIINKLDLKKTRHLSRCLLFCFFMIGLLP